MRLTKDFYLRPAEEAAPALLGKLLCIEQNGMVLRRRIVETECYQGEEDTACHAHRGRTPRTSVLYEEGGLAYLYLCYGIHHLLNVVTGSEGHPQAVLIRGIEGAIGPGRVTKSMGITTALNREDLCTSRRLWLEDDGAPAPVFTVAPRVGIGYADPKDQERLWRFIADVSS